MTAQQLLVASLDWKAVLLKAGVKFSEQTTRSVNSLVEYLAARAELEQDEACPCDGPGTPYSGDLKETTEAVQG